MSLEKFMQEAYDKFKNLDGGKNASYIPYLANVNSNLSALVAIDINGKILKFGDFEYRFAIESISKVITLALALMDLGESEIREKIGDSPTGLGFNSVMALELHKDKPLSPLVNAGAMATTSIIKASNKDQRWERILDFQRKFMSERVSLSDDVNNSEQSTNFHNRAIAWLLYSANHMFCDPMEACEVYTKGCSTLIDCIDLATLGVTLANNGINPITKERVVDEEFVPKILSQMIMEGMYEASGDWAYRVGIPAKSGVGGGIIAVIPNVMAIAGFSPKLDKVGNSIKAEAMISYVCKKMGFNIFKPKSILY